MISGVPHVSFIWIGLQRNSSNSGETKLAVVLCSVLADFYWALRTAKTVHLGGNLLGNEGVRPFWVFRLSKRGFETSWLVRSQVSVATTRTIRVGGEPNTPATRPTKYKWLKSWNVIPRVTEAWLVNHFSCVIQGFKLSDDRERYLIVHCPAGDHLSGTTDFLAVFACLAIM